MNKGFKILLAILLGAYILSPVDLVPACPIDDIILLLITLASTRKLGQNTRREAIEEKDVNVIDQYPS